MNEPVRITGLLPRHYRERAVKAMVDNLPSRLDYAPEPYATRTLHVSEIRQLAHGDGDPENRKRWVEWRNELTKRRSQNECRLESLMWAAEEYERLGDAFGAGVVRDWLEQEWGVTAWPAGKSERAAMIARVCAPDVRAGAIDPTAPWLWGDA